MTDNKFMSGLKTATNYTYTENGALTHKSTLNALYDLFAMGGAYRKRSDDDCIALFSKAYNESPVYAMKCLFYLRDILQGQGERRFFRVIITWLAHNYPKHMKRNMAQISEFGRWDDFYAFVDTPLENDAFIFLEKQFKLDLDCKTPSLLAKWLKSCNTSSEESRQLGKLTCKHFHMTEKEYRKNLSKLRERINIVERLMSQNKWEEIEFDKIPSCAGLKYRNAFARRDIIKQRYKDFALDKNTTVNAKALYPYDCIHKVYEYIWKYRSNKTEEAMLNKYWDNLTDYIQGTTFNGIAVVDVSGSMAGTPIEVAVSLGLYCAEKALGPYHNHFITFSAWPELVEVTGATLCEKVRNMSRANWDCNTNIEATFDLLLDTAIKNHCTQDEIPQNLIIISDMEFDNATNPYGGWGYKRFTIDKETLIENIRRKWNAAGYEMPHLVFWNVDARQDNIPMNDEKGITFVSGMSPVLYEQIMQGKTAQDLMYDKLNSARYSAIT